jgi:hypothetical protein
MCKIGKIVFGRIGTWMVFRFLPNILVFLSLETKVGHFSMRLAAVWLRVLNVFARIVAFKRKWGKGFISNVPPYYRCYDQHFRRFLPICCEQILPDYLKTNVISA